MNFDRQYSADKGFCSQKGSASVLSASIVFVVMFLSVFLSTLVFALSQYSKCQSVADLSAVAGAKADKEGLNGCDTAKEVASKNGYRLNSCLFVDEDIRVSVEKQLFSQLGDIGTIRTKAVAGYSRKCRVTND